MKKTLPKIFRDELDNPYSDSDRTKEVLWALERIVYADDESYARALKNGMTFMFAEDSPIPSSISDSSASLEERILLSYMYMCYAMTTGNDKTLIDEVDWTSYFEE